MRIDKVKSVNSRVVSNIKVGSQPHVSRIGVQVNDSVKLGTTTPTEMSTRCESPEDKLPLASSILFIPVIVGAISSAINYAIDKLRLTDYRKRLEKILFKQENLTYNNFDKFVEKLKKDPELASKLLKTGIMRMHQIQKYDNKAIDRDPEEGVVDIRDERHKVRECGIEGVYYTYRNEKRGVEVEVDEDILAGKSIYISVYKPINDSQIESRTVQISYEPSTKKARVGDIWSTITPLDEYERRSRRV